MYYTGRVLASQIETDMCWETIAQSLKNDLLLNRTIIRVLSI